MFIITVSDQSIKQKIIDAIFNISLNNLVIYIFIEYLRTFLLLTWNLVIYMIPSSEIKLSMLVFIKCLYLKSVLIFKKCRKFTLESIDTSFQMLFNTVVKFTTKW